jgi:acetyl esterase/lipase
MERKLWLRQDNRIDTKWAHPGALGGINWAVPGLLDTFFEMVDKDPAENVEDRRMQRQVILEGYLENESEKRKAAGEWHFVKGPGCAEEPETEVELCLRIPKNVENDDKLPCVIEIPGGGLYIAGSYEYYMGMLASLAKHKKAVVVSMNYRTCVEAPYPAAVNDCHAAYQFILDHADEYNIDTDKIVLHGFSTGAQLALCLGFRLKRYGIRPRGIVASLPIVDDVNANQSGSFSFRNDETNTVDAWDAEGIRLTMQKWLGEHYGDPALPPEALPSRATIEDCVGYPPVWIPVISEMDGSRDATLEFCRTLHAANVFVDYHVWGGCNHNTTDPSTPIGSFMAQGDEYNIGQAIEFNFSRPWTE